MAGNRSWSVKRVLMAVMGLGYLGLLFDAYVGHALSGSGLSEPPQYFPLIFAPLAALVLLVLGAREVSTRTLARITFWVGAVSMVVGLGGVVFHLIPLVQELAEEALTVGALTDVLGDVPPLLAPGAFFAVGALVMAVGAPRVRISVEAPEGEPGNTPG